VFLWSTVEVSIGISVAGIIELGPLMRRFKVKGFDKPVEDRNPIRLQDMDKSTSSFMVTQKVGAES
jgi:hypothetical protein